MNRGGFSSAVRVPAMLFSFHFELENVMNRWLAVLACVMLTACGAETATSAATAAAVKKQELEQGQKTMDQVQQKIGESIQQMQQSTQRAAD